jgi:hypothetical protein
VAENSSPDNFHFNNSDNNGVTGQTPASPASQVSAAPMSEHDSFVFAPGSPLGTASSASWADITPSGNSATANNHAAWTAAHDDAGGNAAVPDAAHLWAHHGFHFV